MHELLVQPLKCLNMFLFFFKERRQIPMRNGCKLLIVAALHCSPAVRVAAVAVAVAGEGLICRFPNT